MEAATEAEHTGGIAGTLGINWKLFIAQLVNFSIVLFVFWKWIVKPLAKTLTERQEKIEKGLKYSEAMEEEKKKFESWKAEEMKKVRTEADSIMRSSMEVAEKQKMDTISQAQKQANRLLEQAKQTLESEKQSMISEVRAEAADLIIKAAEKIIKTKIDSSKDKELITESLRNIK